MFLTWAFIFELEDALQICAGFCCTAWTSDKCTHIPSLWSHPPTLPWAPCTIQWLPTIYLFYTWERIHVNAALPVCLAFSFPLRVHVSILYVQHSVLMWSATFLFCARLLNPHKHKGKGTLFSPFYRPECAPYAFLVSGSFTPGQPDSKLGISSLFYILLNMTVFSLRKKKPPVGQTCFYLGECNLFFQRVSKQFKKLIFSVVILVKTGRSKCCSTEVNRMF